MKERTALILAVLVILWLSVALVRVENERYAMQVGLCWNEPMKMFERRCLERTETRTAWYWHLFYALKG